MDWRKLQFWRMPLRVAKNPGYKIIAEYEARNPLDGDALVVDGLRNAGADLSQPRDVLHYFYFPNEANAECVSAELRRYGFSVRRSIQSGADGKAPNPHSVIATINGVVNIDSAQESTRRFRTLASRYSGEYDGWEAAAVP